MGRKPIHSDRDWMAAAKACLIEHGIAGVQVTRLAERLQVSRGGFHHFFGHRSALLQRLLHHWESDCRFLPDGPVPRTRGDAIAWLDRASAQPAGQPGYDPRFDAAIRAWARSDALARLAVERVDSERIIRLQRVFEALGHKPADASIHATILYSVQIGYYATDANRCGAEASPAPHAWLAIALGAGAGAGINRPRSVARPAAHARADRVAQHPPPCPARR